MTMDLRSGYNAPSAEDSVAFRAGLRPLVGMEQRADPRLDRPWGRNWWPLDDPVLTRSEGDMAFQPSEIVTRPGRHGNTSLVIRLPSNVTFSSRHSLGFRRTAARLREIVVVRVDHLPI